MMARLLVGPVAMEESTAELDFLGVDRVRQRVRFRGWLDYR